MTTPIIAASLGAALIVLQMLLMMSTGLHRAKTSIGVGTGDDQHLERKMRRHGNLAENAALFTLVLALAELSGGAKTVLMAFAGAFLTARLLHIIGFMSLSGSHAPGENWVFAGARAVGALGTAFSGIGLGGYLTYILVMAAG